MNEFVRGWNRRLALVAVIVGLSIVATGCGGDEEPPVQEMPPVEEGSDATSVFDVSMEISRAGGAVPFPVEFVAIVDGASREENLSYQWDFGGLGESSEASPAFVFEEAGSHAVRLDVTDDEGHHVGSATRVIRAEEIGVEAMASAVEGMAPLQVEFSCQSTGATDVERRWEFGDGQRSELSEPTYIYSSAGVFRATCIGTAPSGA